MSQFADAARNPVERPSVALEGFYTVQRLMDPVILIGLDAAAQPANFGYAVGSLACSEVRILQAGCLSDSALSDICSAVSRATHCVIAVDAPLGWPSMLSGQLIGHSAGMALAASKDRMFKRLTDQRLIDRLEQRPLEVAADKIARASHTALQVIEQVRLRSGRPLDLLWSPSDLRSGVIEVYPAATLKSRGLPNSKYKRPEQRAQRVAIANALSTTVEGIHQHLDAKADVFDAVLCLVAASDFVAGHCMPPDPSELHQAKREGWIWVSGSNRDSSAGRGSRSAASEGNAS